MKTTIPVPRLTAAACGAAMVCALAGCASEQTASDAALSVTVSIYPLEFVATAVGGELVEVTSLVRPGVEPHDLELSPATARGLASADLVLYIEHFQPAVDDALASIDVPAASAHELVTLHPAKHEHDHDEDHEDHEEAGHEGHDHGDLDPHFWLDPALFAEYTLAVGEQFAALDAANAETYRANADALAAQLAELDASFSQGLSSCERDDIVVGHEAFGYLADAYGLHQVAVAGLDPDAEPSPARVREIVAHLKVTGATTVFTETTAGSVVDAIAADAGVTAAVLSPVETATGDDDYIAIMTRNLEALRAGLGCD